jgi:hypothetical protein
MLPAALLVERTGLHPRGRPRAYRGRQLAHPGDAADTLSVAPPRELVDATADGIPLLRVDVVWVSVKVGITVIGIDAEDGEVGATVRTAEAQQRRPRHPRGGAHLVATAARPQAEAEEGGRSGRSV